MVARLVEIRGIGAWTAEMLLIFRLGRPDVLPATDYGVRKGFARAFRRGSAHAGPGAPPGRTMAALPDGRGLVSLAGRRCRVTGSIRPQASCSLRQGQTSQKPVKVLTRTTTPAVKTAAKRALPLLVAVRRMDRSWTWATRARSRCVRSLK